MGGEEGGFEWAGVRQGKFTLGLMMESRREA